MTVPSPVSAAKLQANRQNAGRSTGPRTLGGKRRSSSNAVTHGLTATHVILNAGSCREDPHEFDSLRDSLSQEWQPRGPLEECLLDRIVVCLWRQRRALRFERGDTQRHGASIQFRDAERRRKRARLAVLLGDRDALLGMSLGLERVLTELDEIRRQVGDGVLTAKAREWLRGFEIELPVSPAESGHGQLISGSATQLSADVRMACLTKLARVRTDLRAQYRQAQEAEGLTLKAELLRRAIPSRRGMARLRRYETPVTRELYQAIAALQRARRQRMPTAARAATAQPRSLRGDATHDDRPR